eukprot:1397178-Rhodomonas_salina.2
MQLGAVRSARTCSNGSNQKVRDSHVSPPPSSSLHCFSSNPFISCKCDGTPSPHRNPSRSSQSVPTLLRTFPPTNVLSGYHAARTVGPPSNSLSPGGSSVSVASTPIAFCCTSAPPRAGDPRRGRSEACRDLCAPRAAINLRRRDATRFKGTGHATNLSRAVERA